MKIKNRDEFARGYFCAIGSMLAGHGDDTVIREAVRSYGPLPKKCDIDVFDWEQLEKHGYVNKARKRGGK